jgi:hypothetical protein
MSKKGGNEMSKRLILALVAAAAVALITAPAFAAVQNVKVSGDLEIMPLARNSFDLKGEQRGTNAHEENAILSFLRLRVDADLTDNVSVTTRLLNERDWDNTNTTAVDLDLAYVTLKEFLYSPLTLTLGRQELHMGSEMIVGDPDTNNAAVGNLALSTTANTQTGQPDLSKKKAFDAMRATLDYSPLVIDAIYAKITEGDHGDKGDETLLGLDANYDLKDKWNSALEAYLYDRTRGKNNIEANQDKKDVVDVVGARVVTNPIENLVYSLEAAYQFGQRYDATNEVGLKRRACALETGANYTWAKARYTPSLTLLYAFFSGDAPATNGLATNKYKAWDAMYENQSYGDIAGALLAQSNIQVAGIKLSAKPTEDVVAKVTLHGFWWVNSYDEGDTITSTAHTTTANLDMDENSFAGTELDAYLSYDYTEDVQFGLTAGMFRPGSAFADINNRTASQVLGSMLVKF